MIINLEVTQSASKGGEEEEMMVENERPDNVDSNHDNMRVMDTNLTQADNDYATVTVEAKYMQEMMRRTDGLQDKALAP